MKISEAAQRSGVLATTIRFYESIGLLPPPRIGGQRIYGTEVLDRLAVIRFGLKTGFSLKELKALFLGLESRARRRTAAQSKLKELKGLRDRIKLMERLLREIRLPLRDHSANRRAFIEIRSPGLSPSCGKAP